MLILLFSMSCDKKDYSSEVVKNDYRIKTVKQYSHVELFSMDEYTYVDEQVTQVVVREKDYSDWVDYRLDEYEYEHPLITIITNRKSDNIWEPSDKTEYLYNENNLLTEQYFYNYYGGSWHKEQTYNYTYENSKIKEVVFMNYGDGWFTTPSSTIEFIYTNSKLIEIRIFTFNDLYSRELTDKIEVTYPAHNLTELLYFKKNDEGNWTQEQITQLIYSANKLIEINIFTKSDGSDTWNEDLTLNYYYNENGYLREQNIDNFSVIYEYEIGHGNAALFNHDNVSLFGSIIPLYIELNIPTLKRYRLDSKNYLNIE